MTGSGLDARYPDVLWEIERSRLKFYAEVIGVDDPIYIDVKAARMAGHRDISALPSLFAQGMLGMAWLSRFLVRWVPQSQLCHWQERFVGIIHLGNEITCTGSVVKKYEEMGEKKIALDIVAVNQYGEVKISGQAVVRFSYR